MQKVYFTYLDFMRHMKPHDVSNDISFSVFGNFDALHVSYANSFEELKKKHEQRHRDVSWNSERQPMFLTSIEKPENLFDHERYSSYPLVLIVMQVEKHRLEGISYQALLGQANLQLGGYLKNTGAFGQCLFNLGQSDLTLVVRAPLLACAVKAIAGFWNDGIDIGNEQKLRLLSTSSHCAFPAGNVDDLKRSLGEWLEREAKQPDEERITFRVDYVLSAGFSAITSEPGKELLFGDHDVTDNRLELSEPGIAEKLAQILIYHSMSSGGVDEDGKEKRYVTSSTLPLIHIEPFGFHAHNNNQESEYDNWNAQCNELRSRFNALVDCIAGQSPPWEDRDALKNTISSISLTLEGMYKYLHRLGESCFEYDLEAYAKPVFEMIVRIIEQLTQRLEQPADTDDEWKERYAQTQEFVSHTVELVTELQHLFSVLSISPNTFVETYGSSMRSLNAGSTLMSAYQGVLHFLNRCLPSQFFKGNSGEKANSEHAILLLPYRVAQSSGKIMYASFMPQWRLSLIHVDFTRMFNVRETLFMLSHESGHMLGAHRREERFGFFVDAAIRQYLEQNVLSWYFANPVEAFFALADQNDAGIPGQKSMIRHGMSPENWSAVSDSVEYNLKRVFGRVLDEATEKIANQFKSKYEKNRTLTDATQFKSYYLNEVARYLTDYINSIFNSGKDSKAVENIAMLVLGGYQEVARNTLALVKQYPCNRRFFCKVVAFYHAQQREQVLYRRMMRSGKSSTKEVLEHMKTMFRDIHADIFMCKLLGVLEGDYAKMLRQFSGYTACDSFTNPCNLIRFDMVYSKYYHKELDSEILRGQFGLSSELTEQCMRLLAQQRSSTAYVKYREYAEMCCEEMDGELRKIEDGVQLKNLRNMYRAKDDSIEMMDALLSMYAEIFRSGKGVKHT